MHLQNLIVLSLSFLNILLPRSDSTVICSDDWIASESSGTCIRLYKWHYTWSTARAICQKEDGDLVVILDETMNNFVAEQIEASPDGKLQYWIGLHDTKTEGTFVWLNETEQASYTSWSEPPDNYLEQDCVYITDKWDPKLWADGRCSWKKSYICEKSPEEQSTTPATNPTSTSLQTTKVNMIASTITYQKSTSLSPTFTEMSSESARTAKQGIESTTNTAITGNTASIVQETTEMTTPTMPTEKVLTKKNNMEIEKDAATPESLGAGAVAGIVIAGVVVCVAGAVIAVLSWRRFKTSSESKLTPGGGSRQLVSVSYVDLIKDGAEKYSEVV